MSFQIACQTLKCQKYKAIILFILLHTHIWHFIFYSDHRADWGFQISLKDMKDWRIWYI